MPASIRRKAIAIPILALVLAVAFELAAAPAQWLAAHMVDGGALAAIRWTILFIGGLCLALAWFLVVLAVDILDDSAVAGVLRIAISAAATALGGIAASPFAIGFLLAR